MISPHTPPGTYLVVVADDMATVLAAVRPEFRDLVRAYWHRHGFTQAFKVGDKFVLQSVEPVQLAVCGFGCRLVGLSEVWALECFDVAALPGCLTEILREQPLDVPEDATC